MKRILFIEPQPCMRTLKLAYGLKWLLGSKGSLVFGPQGKTLTEFYGYGDEFFDEFVLMSKDNPEKSISTLVKQYRPYSFNDLRVHPICSILRNTPLALFVRAR